MKNLSDHNLVEKITTDKNAFKILYNRYYDTIYRFLMSRTKSIVDTDDLIQELFIRVWRNRFKIKSHKSIKAYLFSIAYTISIDHNRKQQRERSRTVSFEENNHFHNDEISELQEKVIEFIETLPENFRDVFILNRYDGLKYTEIAAVCNVSVKTVEYRMSKALHILKDKLSKEKLSKL